MTAFLLYCLITFRLDILDFFRNLWYSLVSGMRRLMQIRIQEETEIRKEYTDKSELLEPAEKIRFSGRTSWSRQYRNYLKIKNPAEQFRAGYALWLTALHEWQIAFQSSDTPNRILEKSQGAPNPELTKAVTSIYYRVRYQEADPTPEESALLRELLVQTKRCMKTVKK